MQKLLNMMKKEGFSCLLVLVLTTLISEARSYPDGSSTESQNRPRLPVISVWARKAGGNLKPEFLSPIRPSLELPPTKPQREITNGESEELFNAVLNPMPTVAFPAKTTVAITTSSTTEAPSSTNSPKALKDDVYNYESSEEDEEECPEDQFWHLRGQRCVPLNCPAGISKRNTQTGECIDLFVGWGSRGRRRMYPYAKNRYYAKHMSGTLAKRNYNASRGHNRIPSSAGNGKVSTTS